jgi:hypothetical protein
MDYLDLLELELLAEMEADSNRLMEERDSNNVRE